MEPSPLSRRPGLPKKTAFAKPRKRIAPALPRSKQETIIKVENLTMGWGDTVLQKDMNFEVKRGEVFTLLGGSGCGKSTLLRYMTGLEPITMGGSITVAGKTDIDLDDDLPPFGVMFQAGALFGSMTVGENVELPLEEWTDLTPDAVSAIARAKLKLVGLDQAYDKFPSELSGGMKKRAAIARALALDPELVFLDEPSAGLDPITSSELDDLILTLNKSLGLTVIIVTHELDSIFKIATRGIMLDKETKSIIAEGDPKELAKSDDPRVSKFFRRESKNSKDEKPEPAPESRMPESRIPESSAY